MSVLVVFTTSPLKCLLCCSFVRDLALSVNSVEMRETLFSHSSYRKLLFVKVCKKILLPSFPSTRSRIFIYFCYTTTWLIELCFTPYQQYFRDVHAAQNTWTYLVGGSIFPTVMSPWWHNASLNLTIRHHNSYLVQDNIQYT